jgi:hypothetical protein
LSKRTIRRRALLALLLAPSPLTDPLAAHGLGRVLLLLARHAKKAPHDPPLLVRNTIERIVDFWFHETIIPEGG